MSLAKKYNIPKEAVQRMVNDGVISCSWPMYEEIYAMYQQSMAVGGKTKTEIYYEISEAKKVSERTVKYVISRFTH